MTGFGRFELSTDDKKVSVEIKSVNHRYLDLNIKIPSKLNFIDADIRNKIKEYVERGKVDVYISYNDMSEGDEVVVCNENLAKEYIDAYAALSAKFDIDNDVKTSYIMRSPGVVSLENAPQNEDDIRNIVIECVGKACEDLVNARAREGEKLKENLLIKLDNISRNVDIIEEKSPLIINEYREKIEKKIKELLDDNNIDESRIVQEVTIFADKICVDEEIVRLQSHVHSMKDTLQKDGAIGRSLDFLTQEMNREANTTLSKTTDKDLAEIAIELKTDIEKVREQIQNIE